MLKPNAWTRLTFAVFQTWLKAKRTLGIIIYLQIFYWNCSRIPCTNVSLNFEFCYSCPIFEYCCMLGTFLHPLPVTSLNLCTKDLFDHVLTYSKKAVGEMLLQISTPALPVTLISLFPHSLSLFAFQDTSLI